MGGSAGMGSHQGRQGTSPPGLRTNSKEVRVTGGEAGMAGHLCGHPWEGQPPGPERGHAGGLGAEEQGTLLTRSSTALPPAECKLWVGLRGRPAGCVAITTEKLAVAETITGAAEVLLWQEATGFGTWREGGALVFADEQWTTREREG